MTKPFCLSFGFRSTPSAIRDQLARRQDAIEDRLRSLVDSWLILATCNRFEIWGMHSLAGTVHVGDGAARFPDDLRSSLLEILAEASEIETEELAPYCRFTGGQDAMRHMFAVASGLESLVLGEGQVLGQLREAFARAAAAGHCRGTMAGLTQHALRVGKRVRSETSLGRGKITLPECALDVARSELGSLEGRTVLIVGAGKMSRLALQAVAAARACVIVANRTMRRAEELAIRCGGKAIPLSDLTDALISADVVITAIAADRPVIVAADVTRAELLRPAHRILIDLAVPPAVDPQVARKEKVRLLRVDDLAGVVGSYLAERQLAERPALDIIEQEIERHLQARQAEVAGPTIRDLLERAETIRRCEVERFCKGSAPEQIETLERLSRSLMKTLLHDPIVQTRALSTESEVLALVRKLFALEPVSAGG